MPAVYSTCISGFKWLAGARVVTPMLLWTSIGQFRLLPMLSLRAVFFFRFATS
jgi:hypothetical protein